MSGSQATAAAVPARGWRRPVGRLLVGVFVVLTAVGVWLALANQDWSVLGDLVAHGDRGRLAVLLAGSVVVNMAGLLLAMLVWWVVLRENDPPVSTAQVARIFFVGFLAKYVPGRVLALVASFRLARSAGVSAARMASGVALTLVVTVLTGLAVGLLAGTRVLGDRAWWLLLAAVPVVVVAVRPRLVDRAGRLAMRLLRRPAPAVGSADRTVRLTIAAQTLSWLVSGLHLWLLAIAVGAPPLRSLLLCVGAFSLAVVVGLVVMLVPDGIGVREAVLTAALSAVLPLPAAAVVVVASRLVSTVSEVGLALAVLGVTGLTHRRRKATALDEPAMALDAPAVALDKSATALDEPAAALDEPAAAPEPPAATGEGPRLRPPRLDRLRGEPRLDRLWRLLRPRRRWCWGTWLVVLATTLWSLFLAAHLLLSGRTPLWVPVDVTPPLLFVAVPAALLVVAPLARPARWRIIAVLVVAAVLGAGRSGINLATLWHTPPPAPPKAITLVAWNTDLWDRGWGLAAEPGDTDRFYRYLRELDADVYLLHEYLHYEKATDSPDLKAVQIDHLPRLRAEFPDHEIVIAGEHVTLSRLPIVGRQALDLTQWLPEHLRAVPPELAHFPSYYTTKTLRTDVLLGGKVVSLYNAHVHQPPHDVRLYRAASRTANADGEALRHAALRALRADVTANPNPVVIAGDLNTSPAMGVRRLLPDGLVDNARALSSLYPTSWAADDIPLWRIDWLLSTPDVAVHRYEFRAPRGLSDHQAQVALISA